MKSLTWLLALSCLGSALNSGLVQAAQQPPMQTVTFVCEHGSAKSVIAATYFNAMAKEKGLEYRAVSRGLHPDAQLQGATETGLQQDGLSTAGWQPVQLQAQDEQQSVRVVTMGIEEPGYLKTAKLLEWEGVPAVSAGYAVARDDMVKRIDQLLAQLQAEQASAQLQSGHR